MQTWQRIDLCNIIHSTISQGAAQERRSGARIKKGGAGMCDYDLPLALIFEEILTGRPKEAEQEQEEENKGNG